MKFSDYVQYRENFPNPTDSPDEVDMEGLKKLQKFLLVGLTHQNVFNKLVAQLQEIAADDHTGEMADLLHNIDWQTLRQNAKKMLQKLNKPEEEVEDEDGPVNSDQDQNERKDRVTPPVADRGGEMGGEGGGG